MRGNIVMKGYLEEPAATDAGVRRRLVSHRRSGRACIPTAISRSRTAPRTSSSPGARTSPPSRSRGCSIAIRRCWRRPWWRGPTRHGARLPAPSSTPRPRRAADGRGNHRLLPRADGALQGAEHGGLRPPAQDLDRQDPEIRPARSGEGARLNQVSRRREERYCACSSSVISSLIWELLALQVADIFHVRQGSADFEVDRLFENCGAGHGGSRYVPATLPTWLLLYLERTKAMYPRC